MTKEELYEKERQIVEEFNNYFKQYPYDENSDNVEEMDALIRDSITRLFILEMEELGYNYNPNNSPNENDISLDFVKDASARQWYGVQNSGRRIDEKSGQIIIEKPKITFNLTTLTELLMSQNSEKKLQFCRDFFRWLIHEMQHEADHLSINQKISDKYVLMYARDFLLADALDGFYQGKKSTQNYSCYITENHANYIAYDRLLHIGYNDDETRMLRDIECGKMCSESYRADAVCKLDGTHYFSNGEGERNDIAIPIVDDLIGRLGMTDYLQIFPVLQKEYNLDGSKKRVLELVKNMQFEIQEVIDSSLSSKQKLTKIETIQSMYYELIFNQLVRSTQNQLEEYAQSLGLDFFSDLLEKIGQDFNKEKQYRIQMTAKMHEALKKRKEPLKTYNNGTIKCEKDGKIIDLDVDNFITTLPQELRIKKFNILGENEQISGDEYVKEFIFKHLSQSGYMTLMTGERLTAKDFVCQMLSAKNSVDSSLLMGFGLLGKVESEDWFYKQQDFEARMNDIYGKKQKILDEILQKVSHRRDLLSTDALPREAYMSTSDTMTNPTINLHQFEEAAKNPLSIKAKKYTVGDVCRAHGKLENHEETRQQ